MFRSKKSLVFAVVALIAMASAVFALDVRELRQQMWTWSSLESVLHDAYNGGGAPVVSPPEAQNCIEEARAKITKMVAEIKTAEEMKQAREVATEFINMQDHEEEVGVSLNKMLDMQEKYLKAHNEL